MPILVNSPIRLSLRLCRIARIVLVMFETVSIVSVQSAVRAQPQEAVVVLRDALIPLLKGFSIDRELVGSGYRAYLRLEASRLHSHEAPRLPLSGCAPALDAITKQTVNAAHAAKFRPLRPIATSHRQATQRSSNA